MHEQRNADPREHRAAVNERIRRGETVTVLEVIEADDADRTRDDLDRLAERLTSRTGERHHVYLDRRRYLVVYPETYEQPLGLVRS